MSGAHLNPAVTLGLAIEGGTSGAMFRSTWARQLLGAMIGALLVWVAYYGQFHAHLTDQEILAAPPPRKA